MDRGAHSFSVKNESGFTLVEILVSLVILLILVVAFVPMFTFVAQAVSNNQGKDTATALANKQIEYLRTLPFIVLDPVTGEIDTTKAQLGIVDGNPPGSVPAQQVKTINGKEYTIKTNISWDESVTYKNVSVTVEYAGAFNKLKQVVATFHTAAAEEGTLGLPNSGHILVKILDNTGSQLSSASIPVKIEAQDGSALTQQNNTENGETIFGVLEEGYYMVSAQIPDDMTYSPEQTIVEGWLVLDNVEVDDGLINEVEFYIDYGAKINLSLEDNAGNSIVGNGILELQWSNGTNSSNLSPIAFTANDFVNNYIPAAKIGNLWPGGSYSLKLTDVLDSSTLKAYTEYDMSVDGTPRPQNNSSEWDGTLQANDTTNLTVKHFTQTNSLLKVHLYTGTGMLETEFVPDDPSIPDGSGVYRVTRWKDQSGNNYDAVAALSQAPELKETAINDLPVVHFTGSKSQIITIDSRSVSTDNFTIFVVAKPEETHQIDTESTTSIEGVWDQKYLFWPEWGGYSNAGQGLSLGTNGISNYEHANGYMPPTAVYSGDMSSFNAIAVNYDEKTPFIYINGEMRKAGIESPRVHVSTPQKVGGDGYGYFTGDVAAILIYSSSLSEANMELVSNYLMSQYNLP
ncbi:MAG: prepilin-type N-terminal cleavage/methylation domain-containing protein [Syntrophomonadaceae bacterium]|nr:prepilin-type N-terminal cleavage/methylation domain-containing protein [Syntrophomonadaceae bacterium]